MTKDMIDTKQVELHFDAANEAAEKSSKMARGAVIEAIEAGEQLCRAKECVPHGEWSVWLGKHWNYTQKTACQYMLLAANLTSGLNLLEAKSVNEALRIIADDKEEKTAPRSARKPADVVVSKPTGTNETGYRDDSRAATTESPSDHIADADKMVDADPATKPPTNRKTAKGSEKVAEDKKPRTATITPEILPDEQELETLPEEKTLADWSEHEILEFLVSSADDAKRRAKALRKAADKLDPPTKFVKPDLEDVSAYMHTLGDAIGKDTAAAADGFIDHYESNGWMVGKVAMKDWRATARKWLKNQGQFSNGKANGNGHGTTKTQDPASCLGANGRPRVERAKINYK